MGSATRAQELHLSTTSGRKVIFVASLGAALEWYDFFVFGSLAAAIASNFYSNLNSDMGFVFALLTFAAGFIVRPIGALVFGMLGDKAGRKRTFLITILIMGVATCLIGLLPTYGSIGVAAPIALVALRMLQGFSLGGEYGAAATYVAEHAPPNRRGEYTSWIQTTSTIGLLMSLVIVTIAREVSGAHFNEWGWRIPFLFSSVLVIISVFIRRSMTESPAFARISSEGRTSKAPLSEAFGQWKNLRFVLQALFGLLAGQAVVWFTALFYAMFFLTQTLKVDPATANIMVCAALIISTPMYVGLGWLSDRIGRKPIILGGCLLAAMTIFPVFHAISSFANPALVEAREKSPVVLVTDQSKCSWQFNPIGTSRFTNPCDIARTALSSGAASYSTRAVTSGEAEVVLVGTTAISIPSAQGLSKPEAAAAETAFRAKIATTLTQVGYPTRADPAQVNKPMVVLLITILMVYGAMTLAPVSAALVEMFPTRIRYSAMSLPYHIGNGYFGGLLPAICFAIVIQTGDIYAGLWYPVAVAGISFIVGLFFVRETRKDDIFADD